MKLLYILSAFFLSCSTEPEVKDCAGVENGAATIDDCGLCTGGTTANIANYLKDCAGECGGDATEDCLGECNGLAVTDNCGTCDSDATNDCVQDCAGVWGGFSYEDECGGCDANVNNDGYMDYCGVCDTDSTNNNTTCVQDCAGDWGGEAIVDMCDNCDSDTTNDCTQDCAEFWGGTLLIDNCGICDGDNTVCAGCDGVPNSGLVFDCAGECGGAAVVDCAGECGGFSTDCHPINSLWFNAHSDGTWGIGYSSNIAIGGLQLTISGSTIISVISGDAQNYGFSISAYEDSGIILGFSFSGATIPAGIGELFSLELDGTPTAITNIIISDGSANSVNFSFDSSP